ncbi:MAG: hypothetical protein IPG53_03490 [Ignavibacteriales bacterium]|nr:hypothetical protein [Ignavibacteriales bacterium]
MKLEDGKTETKYENVKKRGIAQLKKYLESDHIKSLDNLKTYLVIFRRKTEGK